MPFEFLCEAWGATLRIAQFERTSAVGDLEAALLAQKSFWKLLGVTLAVMFAVGLVMMAVFLAIAALMRSGFNP